MEPTPLQVRTTTGLAHYHALYLSPTQHQLQVQITPGHNDLQIRKQGNPGDPSLGPLHVHIHLDYLICVHSRQVYRKLSFGPYAVQPQ